MAKHRSPVPPRATPHAGRPARRRRKFGALLGALLALAAVTTVAVLPTSATSGSGVTTYYGVCRTDADGYCWERHELGIVPAGLAVRPRLLRKDPGYSLSVVTGSATATKFRLRALLSDGRPKADSLIRFIYWVTGTQPTTTTTTSITTTTTTTTTPPPATTTTTAPREPAPPTGTAGKVCGTSSLDGPSSAPSGAITVPAGDNSGVDFGKPATTYWFAPGTHTLGTSIFDQIGPGDGSTFIGAPGAVIDGKDINRYFMSGHGKGVTVEYLEVRGFTSAAQEGVVNHDGGQGWTMSHLNVHDNGGAAVMLGGDNVLQDSCITRNGQYAWNSIGGSSNITMLRNEISYNNTLGDQNCGCSGGGKFWDAHGVRVIGNWVHHNHGAGIWADQNNYDFLIAENVIEDNEAQAIFYETSYNAVIRDNVLRRNTWKVGKEFASRGDNFPIGTIYLSESGYDARLPAPESATKFVVKNNVLENNWGGIAAWENADRFCNSPANSSTGYCTVPTNLTTDDCQQPGIASEPLYSECRWWTKNLDIHHNTFSIDPAKVDGGCPAQYCAVMALFSNYGTVPDWSPYKGRKIQEAITFGKNNRWHDNTYTGPWKWVPYETGRYLTLAQWQAAPYHQDTGSTGG